MPSKKDFSTVEEYRTYFRDYRAKNKEKLQDYNVKYMRSWREKNGSSKDAVRAKVRWALKKGTLIKLPCSVCGDVKSQGHHEDYSKPLEVIWLCNIHHKEVHIKDIPSIYNKFTLH